MSGSPGSPRSVLATTYPVLLGSIWLAGTGVNAVVPSDCLRFWTTPSLGLLGQLVPAVDAAA